jgi:NAD(P)H-hydrate epimerase
MTNVSNTADLSGATGAYLPAQVRELDRIAIEEQGIPGYELMTRAGQAFFAAAVERYPAAHRWLILCGSGNNAGDGYVIARLALDAGLNVQVVACSDPAKLAGDAATARQDFNDHSNGSDALEWTGSIDAGEHDLLIDALLGTGLDRDLGGAYLDAVAAINATGLPALAVDIPSGLNGATGAIMGAAVNASLTVSFVGLKQGCLLGKGPDVCGELLLDDLGIAPVADTRVPPSLHIFGPAQAEQLLPRRARSGHKGTYGHVLVIGGNTGMGGAVRLAGEAALRSGAGLVSVATRPEHTQAILEARPELMCRGITAAADIDELLARASVLALGPGLGQDDWAQQLFHRALAAGKPLVVDADALNLLAGAPVQRNDWVLTPHPGEAGRLLESSSGAVQADRLAALEGLVRRYGGTVLLKGHGTLVASADTKAPWLIRGGNPGMGTAGMGDVLTGVTAAMLAQFGEADGGNFKQVAATAAWLHATAGDRAAVGGERGLIASDLFTELRKCLNPGPAR